MCARIGNKTWCRQRTSGSVSERGMLKTLYQFRTKCCGNDDIWQYSLKSRVLCCQFCGTEAAFAALPCEMLPPVRDAHTPEMVGICPIRVAFIPSDRNRGFLNFAIGDELHSGVIDTQGRVRSYSPKEKKFRCESSRMWKQSIVCEFPEIDNVDGTRWDQIIMEEIKTEPPSPKFDCLDFAVNVLNRAAGANVFTRENLSERMGRQLYHVMKFAEIQRQTMQR